MFEASGRGGVGGEFLVILEPAAAQEALERLRSDHQVTQIGSPRVVVVAVSPGEEPPSPSIPGVAAVSGGAMPPDVGEELDERETLFVAAWVSRMTGPEKQRRGEGLPWDAPSFEPPDPPAEGPPPGERPLDSEPWDSEEASAPDYTATEVPEAVEPARVVPLGTRLTGTVAVGVVIVDGPIPELMIEDAERTNLVAEVQNGLTWLGSRGAQAVTWIYDFRRVILSVLPDPGDTTLGLKEARWLDPAMVQLGFEASAAGVVAYVESLRADFDANSAYCVFFTRYPLGHFAYTFLDGKHIVMHYDNDGWGPDNIDRVLAHETAHLFGAPDEYATSGCECGGQFGFAKWPNANCQNCAPGGGVPCIMRDNAWAMCRHTSCHLGYDVEVPFVRELREGLAAQAVRNAGLQPRAIGPHGPGAWVWSQSPKGGSLVGACSTVRLLLRTGPIP